MPLKYVVNKPDETFHEIQFTLKEYNKIYAIRFHNFIPYLELDLRSVSPRAPMEQVFQLIRAFCAKNLKHLTIVGIRNRDWEIYSQDLDQNIELLNVDKSIEIIAQ